MSTGKIKVSRDAQFKEDTFEDGVRDYKLEMIIDDLQDQKGNEDENTDEDILLWVDGYETIIRYHGNRKPVQVDPA